MLICKGQIPQARTYLRELNGWIQDQNSWDTSTGKEMTLGPRFESNELCKRAAVRLRQVEDLVRVTIDMRALVLTNSFPLGVGSKQA
jgi:hypothetical protein